MTHSECAQALTTKHQHAYLLLNRRRVMTARALIGAGQSAEQIADTDLDTQEGQRAGLQIVTAGLDVLLSAAAHAPSPSH